MQRDGEYVTHECGMDVGLCMALGRHPAPPGTEVEVAYFYRRVRRAQRRALLRVRAEVRKIRELLRQRGVVRT